MPFQLRVLEHCLHCASQVVCFVMSISMHGSVASCLTTASDSHSGAAVLYQLRVLEHCTHCASQGHTCHVICFITVS